MNKNVKKKRKGFTLIELIIVLAIMAIIAAIAIPNFTAVRNNSRIKADQQSCETIKRTTLMLVADNTVTAQTDATVAKTLSFVKGSDFVITAGAYASGGTFDAKNWTAAEKLAIAQALAEVKAPSASDGTNYTITIAKDGKVTVNTATTGVTTD